MASGNLFPFACFEIRDSYKYWGCLNLISSEFERLPHHGRRSVVSTNRQEQGVIENHRLGEFCH